MRRSIPITLIAPILALLMSSCAATSTARIDYEEDWQFNNYQSFTWVSENPMKVAKTIAEPKKSLQPRIMAAIRANLESAGYNYVDETGAADFLLSFTVGSRDKSGVGVAPSESSETGGRGGWATAYNGGGTNIDYAQGMLAIEVIDAVEQRPVWRGMHGMNILDADEAYVNALIDTAVATIFDDFPPDTR